MSLPLCDVIARNQTKGSCRHRASSRLADATWQGASFLSDVAIQTTTASIVGGVVLMAAACSMYAIAMALRVDGIPN